MPGLFYFALQISWNKKNMGLMQFYDSQLLESSRRLIRNGNNIESNLSDDDAERLELNVFSLQQKKVREKS